MPKGAFPVRMSCMCLEVKSAVTVGLGRLAGAYCAMSARKPACVTDRSNDRSCCSCTAREQKCMQCTPFVWGGLLNYGGGGLREKKSDLRNWDGSG